MSKDEDQRSDIKKTILEATTGPMNLAVAGAATLGAVALQSWPIVALGGVAYAALVAWDLVSPKSTRGAPRKSLPELDQLKDPATQHAVRAIQGARVQIDRALEETPPDVQANLSIALSSVVELEDRAGKLALRAEDLARFLSTVDPRVVKQDVDDLATRAAGTKDPEAKAQYESAHKAREEHLSVLYELGNAKERIAASLVSIAATMEALPAKVVKMRALDAQAMDELSGSVKDELEQMNGEMKSLEEALKTLSEVAV